MTDIFVVSGHAYDYEGGSVWNVRAYRNVEAANALAGRLNDWCLEHGVDATPKGEEFRRAEQATHDAAFQAHWDAWWVARGGEPEPGSAHDEGSKGLVDAFYDPIIDNPPPGIGTPLEDPKFTTHGCGTAYLVKPLQLE